MAPFGGGLGSTGGVCGTLAGALAVIGFTMGKTDVKERDHRLMWKLSYRMVKKFEEITAEYGGTNCADIAGVNWKDRQDVKDFYRDTQGRRQNCVRVIRLTCEYLQQLMAENPVTDPSPSGAGAEK